MNEQWRNMELSYIREMGNPETHVTERELVVLLPVGCYWAKKDKSCSYCGYQPVVDAFIEEYGNVDYVEIIKNEVAKQEQPFQRITFFVGGSFLEIPPKKQIEIMEYVDTLPVNHVFFESRPELITKENIEAVKNCLHDKELMVAIGLETSDATIRNEVHKKGIENKTYLKGINILNNVGIKTLIYVFLKPPVADITDRTAYEDGINTIRYAFETGAYAVEIESGYIVENSAMQKLYNDGHYQCLNLWTIHKVVQDAIKLNMGICRLAYFSDTPEPLVIPQSCPECSERLYEVFDVYRKTLDENIIINVEDCKCKEKWKEEFYA